MCSLGSNGCGTRLGRSRIVLGTVVGGGQSCLACLGRFVEDDEEQNDDQKKGKKTDLNWPTVFIKCNRRGGERR